VLYQDQGRFAEAEPIYLATLAAQKRVLGEEHPDTLRTMNNLAIFYRGENQNDKALAMGERTLELRRRVLGDSHPDTLMSMAILALLDQTMGRYDDAIALTLECLERRRKVLGPEDRYTLGSESLLGLLYLQTKRFDEAAAVLEDCVPVMRRVLGTGHAWTRAAMRDLADALAALGRNDRALALRRELRDLRVAAAEQPDADLATINEAAWNLLTAEPETLRDPARALQFARRACARAEAEGNGALMYYLDTLALAQHMTGDDAAAVESQRRCIALFGESADPEMKASLAEYEAALAKLPEKTP